MWPPGTGQVQPPLETTTCATCVTGFGAGRAAGFDFAVRIGSGLPFAPGTMIHCPTNTVGWVSSLAFTIEATDTADRVAMSGSVSSSVTTCRRPLTGGTERAWPTVSSVVLVRLIVRWLAQKSVASESPK